MSRSITILIASALLAISPVVLAAPDDEARARLIELAPPAPAPALWVGSDAPDLTIERFVKGDAVDGFESGTVYVVEFWATWCGPCIAAFPHLSELDARYGDKVEVVGVNIWERSSGPDRLEEVRAFVEDQGDRMGYSVAVEEGTTMADTWMRPAGQNGIPAAFIVDAGGKIAWIGHPMALDEPLELVTSDSYDLDAIARDAERERLVTGAMRAYMAAFQSEDTIAKSRQIADLLIDSFLDERPEYLAGLAMFILENGSTLVNNEDKRLALRAGAKACKITEWGSWWALHAYAMGLHASGDSVNAIKWGEKALELAREDPQTPDEAIRDIESKLASYKGG